MQARQESFRHRSARPRRNSARWRRALVAFTVTGWSAAAQAQAGIPLTLAEAERLALARSPQVAAQRSMADAAREMAGPAGSLPDPKLIAGFENVPAEGPDRWRLNRDPMTMTRIGLMQDFPRGEKLRLKSERATQDAARSDVAATVAEFAVRREVASAWLARHYAARQSQAIAAQIDEARLQQSTTAALYRSGRAPQADLLAVQATAIELENRATEAALAAERARLALARYVGAGEADRPLAEVERQPEVLLAQAQETVLSVEADVARAGRLPDWSAELTYGIRGADFGNMVSLMVRVDLPWSPGTRQDREYASKLKERDAARAQREDLARVREAEVRQTLAEWEAMRVQAVRVRDELVPLAVRRIEAALASYRGGSGTLAAVLEARRAELDARLAQIGYEQSAARAWAWLATLVPGETMR
jgi:outer membrane protein TolC